MSGIISNYKSLLRYLKTLPSPKEEIKFKSLISKLRKSDDIQRNKRLLSSYVSQITAIKELNYLRSLDSGEKLSQREKIRASARRVGLATPGFFGDEDTK